MKKILQKIALFILGMKHAYTSTTNEGDVIIMTTYSLSIFTQSVISNGLKNENFEFKINEVFLKTLNEHKGTVEDGKCFLAADQFVLGINKDGKIKPIIDCKTEKQST
jgi:hypothetical protein